MTNYYLADQLSLVKRVADDPGSCSKIESEAIKAVLANRDELIHALRDLVQYYNDLFIEWGTLDEPRDPPAVEKAKAVLEEG